jgi:hypothetical protein
MVIVGRPIVIIAAVFNHGATLDHSGFAAGEEEGASESGDSEERSHVPDSLETGGSVVWIPAGKP